MLVVCIYIYIFCAVQYMDHHVSRSSSSMHALVSMVCIAYVHACMHYAILIAMHGMLQVSAHAGGIVMIYRCGCYLMEYFQSGLSSCKPGLHCCSDIPRAVMRWLRSRQIALGVARTSSGGRPLLKRRDNIVRHGERILMLRLLSDSLCHATSWHWSVGRTD